MLLASGAIGFFFGVSHATWQDALEAPQVLAGLVQYPVSTPVHVFFTRTWTVLNELLALALYSGVPERTLTVALSGVVGMLSLQALAVFVLAVSGSAAWAILSAFFLYFTGATAGGVTYPVILLGSPYAHGSIGLAYVLLAISLLGAGHERAGALLLGFAPAVHMSLGLLSLAAVGIAVAGDRHGRGAFVRTWPYLLAGVAAALGIAAIHFLGSADRLSPTLAGWTASASFTHYWGQDHRRPFRIVSGGILLVWASVGLSVFWLGPLRSDVPARVQLLLKILIASALVASALSTVYWLPPARVPNVLYAMMPSRLFNLNILTCMALVIGLAWRYRDSLAIQALLAILVVACSVGSLVDRDQLLSARIGLGVAGPLLIVLAWLGRRGLGAIDAPRVVPMLRRLTLLAPAAILILILPSEARHLGLGMPDPDEPVFHAAAGRPGLLLTAAGIHAVQLRTRRPILLDGGTLDNLPYIPEAIAQTDTILLRVYGIDTRRDVPTGDIGGLWEDAGRALWERRSSAEWQAIGREFGVSDILTPPDWRLRLAEIARSENYVLYRMP